VVLDPVADMRISDSLVTAEGYGHGGVMHDTALGPRTVPLDCTVAVVVSVESGRGMVAVKTQR